MSKLPDISLTTAAIHSPVSPVTPVGPKDGGHFASLQSAFNRQAQRKQAGAQRPPRQLHSRQAQPTPPPQARQAASKDATRAREKPHDEAKQRERARDGASARAPQYEYRRRHDGGGGQGGEQDGQEQPGGHQGGRGEHEDEAPSAHVDEVAAPVVLASPTVRGAQVERPTAPSGEALSRARAHTLGLAYQAAKLKHGHDLLALRKDPDSQLRYSQIKAHQAQLSVQRLQAYKDKWKGDPFHPSSFGQEYVTQAAQSRGLMGMASRVAREVFRVLLKFGQPRPVPLAT